IQPAATIIESIDDGQGARYGRGGRRRRLSRASQKVSSGCGWHTRKHAGAESRGRDPTGDLPVRKQRTMLEIAEEYLQNGWMSIPIPYREKNPNRAGWQTLRLNSREEIAKYFNGGAQNIGILLGEPSRNLVDVDLDWIECLPFARIFLPNTRQFGRKTNPVSHWLYVVEDAARHVEFKAPGVEGKRAKILEIRGSGCQTVFPPSTHKDTGEPILWVGKQAIPRLSEQELYR